MRDTKYDTTEDLAPEEKYITLPDLDRALKMMRLQFVTEIRFLNLHFVFCKFYESDVLARPLCKEESFDID